MRKSGIASLLMVVALAGGPVLVGCDRGPGDRVVNKSEKTTTDPNGNQSTTEQKTVQHPDGSVTKEKHIDSNNTNPNP